MDVPHWFMHVTEENPTNLHPHLEKTPRFRYRPLAELRAARKPRHLARFAIDGGQFLKYRFLRGRPLIKDPLALFSSDWLASEFEMDVVLLVRHPAAFAASLRRLGYRHPFSDFVRQPPLMRDHLGPCERDIRAIEEARGVLDEAALLWRIITSMTLAFREPHPDRSFYRYGDLINDPATRFGAMFERLQLPFASQIRDRIVRSAEPNLLGWKVRVPEDEIARSRARVAGHRSSLYPVKDL